MRLILTGVIAAAAALGAAGTASAADVVAVRPPVAPVVVPQIVPVRTWTACYVGGNVGVGWSHDQVNDEVSGDPIATLNATAVVGGGQVGCDYQTRNNWVIGIQGMLDATGLQADTTSPDLAPFTLHGSIPWFATVTARLGYALDPNLLLYAKGGFAWNHTDAEILTVDSVGFDQSGWTAGGGVEWKGRGNWSMFAEYDYMGFSAQTVSFPNTPNIGRVHQNIQVALLGLNLRFSGAH